MPSGSIFRRLPNATSPPLTLTFDGEAIEARAGDSVASALLAAGKAATRTTPVSGSPRGPYCLMGICFDCLVEIDGVQNLQGCMVEVKAGMVVRSMQGARSVATSSGDGFD